MDLHHFPASISVPLHSVPQSSHSNPLKQLWSQLLPCSTLARGSPNTLRMKSKRHTTAFKALQDCPLIPLWPYLLPPSHATPGILDSLLFWPEASLRAFRSILPQTATGSILDSGLNGSLSQRASLTPSYPSLLLLSSLGLDLPFTSTACLCSLSCKLQESGDPLYLVPYRFPYSYSSVWHVVRHPKIFAEWMNELHQPYLSGKHRNKFHGSIFYYALNIGPWHFDWAIPLGATWYLTQEYDSAIWLNDKDTHWAMCRWAILSLCK